MKNKILLALTLMIGVVTASAQEYYDVNTAPDVRSKAYRPNQVIVKFKSESSVSVRKNANGAFKSAGVNSVDRVLRKYGVAESEQLMPLTGKLAAPRRVKGYNGQTFELKDLSKLYCMKTAEGADINALIEELKALPDVEFAEPNYLVYACATPDDWTTDPLYTEQWGIPAINLPQLWQKPTITSKRPVIAILDTGVEIAHPDLAANIWTNEAEVNGSSKYDDDNNGYKDDLHGWDFVNQTGYIDDYNGHGTHCAGIAAATGGNEKGIVGANPDALIMPVTVMQSDGTGDIATIIKGIDYAAANGADVISMSFGGYAYSIAQEQALGRAYATAVLVAAAGNDGLPICPHQGIPCGQMFPAAFTFVLGVQATNQFGNLAGFSNCDTDGPIYFCPICFSEEQMYNYELKAPGTSIFSTFSNGGYKVLNGTSMACPLVAGAVSRLLQTKEYATKELLFGDLIHTANGGNVDMLATYDITDADRKPNVSLVSWRIEDEKDNDGHFDAGETIKFYPTIRNDWGTAENIQVWMEMGDQESHSVLSFTQTMADFSKPLGSYAKAESANPIEFKMADDVVDGRHIRLKLCVQCDGMDTPSVQEITITAENGVEIGGMIDHDMTLEAGVNYIITKSLTITAGITLTIEPGSTIQVSNGSSLALANGGKLIAEGTLENPIVFLPRDGVSNPFFRFQSDNSDLTFLKYSKFYDMALNIGSKMSYRDCNFNNCEIVSSARSWYNCNFENCTATSYLLYVEGENTPNGGLVNSTNFANTSTNYTCYILTPSSFVSNNFIKGISTKFKYFYKESLSTNLGTIFKFDAPSFYGTALESIVRNNIYDTENPAAASATWKYDLSNMLIQPNPDAHGIVWKVCVNGYDAQDEFDQLPALGVGKHKFEVWYSKKIDETIAPTIAMGVRPPYTQTAIAEDGSWRTETTRFVVKDSEGNVIEDRDVEHSVYTAYLTIKGSMAIDGLNRIYVDGGRDLEYFDIPREDSRFNCEVAAAGSMSTGFFGEAGIGKVTLTWENQDENVDDILGYNMYRYTGDDETTAVKINQRLLDVTEYVDYDVVPGTTYSYFYKIMRTSLTENSPSRTVAVTPVTASKGDANGSMTVDVADVVTEVNYLTGQNPQPFIFEAADVNSDEQINILDIVGTINIIVNPAGTGIASVNDNATCTVENGILYIDTPVAIGGIQISLADNATVTALEALDDFEQVNANGMFLAYSMSGKTLAPGRHALLQLGDAEIESIVLSDALGHNVEVIAGEATVIAGANGEKTAIGIPYAGTIPYYISDPGKHSVRIVIYDALGHIQHIWNGNADSGKHSYTWNADRKATGVYFAVLKVDGKQIGTVKLVKQ